MGPQRAMGEGLTPSELTGSKDNEGQWLRERKTVIVKDFCSTDLASAFENQRNRKGQNKRSSGAQLGTQ